ncbi:MAG: hypothetical protein ACT4PY_04745 [Armatimonadota bacterium]
MIARRCILILVSLAVQPALAGTAPNPQALQAYVTTGRPVPEQIAHIKKTSPQQFGIVVVEALEAPKTAFEEGGVAYYYQEVRGVDWMFVRWFHPDPQAPGDRFKLHYGVRPKRGERPLELKGRGIAFIVPARAQGVFVAEMILAASRESIFEVRRVLIETLP